MFHARVIDQLEVDFARFLFAHGSIPDKAAPVQCSDYNRDLRPEELGPTVILRANNPQDPMSALGQRGTSEPVQSSALPPKADMDQPGRDVCFVPKADIWV